MNVCMYVNNKDANCNQHRTKDQTNNAGRQTDVEKEIDREKERDI